MPVPPNADGNANEHGPSTLVDTEPDSADDGQYIILIIPPLSIEWFV